MPQPFLTSGVDSNTTTELMKTALILHGITGNSQENWFPWAKKELENLNWQVFCPDLPDTNHPDRTKWLNTVKDLLKEIDPTSLTIIGHSLGVATALDYLEQSAKPIQTLISVAGFYEDYGMELNSYFMAEKTIDLTVIKTRVNHIEVIYGDDDPYVPQQTLQNLALGLKVKSIIIPHGGHLNARAGFTEFPLLLDLILNQQ